MNEVSKCAEINSSSFDNVYFPLEDVNIEIWVLKATVRKLQLSSIVHWVGFCQCSSMTISMEHFAWFDIMDRTPGG